MAIVPSSVTKKGTKYAVVKTTETVHYWTNDYWYVIDVESGTAVKKCFSASDAKFYLQALEDGTWDIQHFATTPVFGEPVDLPPSLQAMQNALLNPKPATVKPSPVQLSTTIAATEDMGAFTILEMDDGTYGVLVPSSGESRFGYKTKGGASRAGKKLANEKAAQTLQDMGIDAGTDAVETLEKVYEGRIIDVYSQAAREMADKQAKAMQEYATANAEMQRRLRAGEITQQDYDQWRRMSASNVSWYGDMTKVLSEDLTAADVKAMQMLNGYIPKAYAEGMNFATFQIEGATSIDTSFTLYNESTVARLIANPEGSLLPELPQAKADAFKDAVWSRQKISSCVTQSILQGESVPEAADRLMRVVGMSAKSAMRAARTSLTCAQNLGRLDAGRRAKNMGIDLKKQWIATVDARTRYSHREIDREAVELEEDFSNGCDCPAHLNTGSDPGEVYNCRCAMRYVLPGHEYDDLPDYTREGVAYDEWKNERTTKLAAQKDKVQAQLDEANAKVAELKKMLPPDKDFGSIVQGGAKASQWTPEKVASSEEFYFQKLQKAIAENNSFDIKWYKDRLAQLKEYDDAGRAYAEAHALVDAQLAKWEQKAKHAKEKLKQIGGAGKSANAYSEERRKATRWFSSSKDADNNLRAWTGRAWQSAQLEDKKAINKYTGGAYESYNRPLNGYANGSYRAANFVGVGDVDINEEGFGNGVRAMTRYLQGSVTEQDIWLRRGEGATALAPFFGLPAGTDMTRLSESELRDLIGTSGRIGSFQSCGTTANTGFTWKPVVIEYFVPAGSQAAYVEPFSRCGYGDGMRWDGVSPQSTLGDELETILQRGGSYTLVDFRYDHGGKPTFVMEVHPEDGYWLFQQD